MPFGERIVPFVVPPLFQAKWRPSGEESKIANTCTVFAAVFESIPDQTDFGSPRPDGVGVLVDDQGTRDTDQPNVPRHERRAHRLQHPG